LGEEIKIEKSGTEMRVRNKKDKIFAKPHECGV
jgi:hypothetical protein